MTRVLLTGASGFIGRHLLHTSPRDTTILAVHHRGALRSHPAVTPLRMDLIRPDRERLRDFAPEVILHTAALSALDACERDPAAADRLNVEVTAMLADLADGVGARLIFTSTDQVFDGREGGYEESAPCNPLNAYGRSKRAAESHLLSRNKGHLCVRLATVYGRGVTRTSFLDMLVERVRAGEPVRVFSDEVRNHVAVQDVASVLWRLVRHPLDGILHLGGPEGMTRMALAETLCALGGWDRALLEPVRLAEAGTLARRPVDCSLDLTRLAAWWGGPLRSVHEGLGAYLGALPPSPAQEGADEE